MLSYILILDLLMLVCWTKIMIKAVLIFLMANFNFNYFS